MPDEAPGEHVWRTSQPLAEVLQTLLDAIPDVAIVVDTDGKIVAANQVALDVFGYSATEAVGAPVEALVPEEFRQLHRNQRMVYQAAPQARQMGAGLELWGLRKDGSRFPLDASLAPIVSAERPLVIVIARDITQRKLGEQKLAEQLVIVNATLVAMQGTVVALTRRLDELESRRQFRWRRKRVRDSAEHPR